VHDLLESDTVVDEGAAVRAEWRAEEEQWSRAALERWEHGRRLADVLRDCMHRDDVVTCELPTVTWTGAVVAVGIDVVRLDVGDAPVDVRLTADAPFVLRARAGTGTGPGARDRSGLTTFLARMRELDGTAVCIGTATGSLEGRIRVGRDQVRVTDRDGGIAYVPSGSVWWVRALDD
jgi:hypothetical protein